MSIPNMSSVFSGSDTVVFVNGKLISSCLGISLVESYDKSKMECALKSDEFNYLRSLEDRARIDLISVCENGNVALVSGTGVFRTSGIYTSVDHLCIDSNFKILDFRFLDCEGHMNDSSLYAKQLYKMYLDMR